MQLYRVLENGTKAGFTMLPEDPTRYNMVCAVNSSGQSRIGMIEDWKMNDDGSIAVHCSFGDQSPVTELLLVKVCEEEYAMKKYEVFDNGTSLGLVELSDQPTREELDQARLVRGGLLVPGEIEDWHVDDDGEITIKCTFEYQPHTITLLPVTSEEE